MDLEDKFMSIGQRIKQRREELKLTQPNLAKRINKSPQVISNWERGYTPTINYDDVAKLAEALSIEPNWLLGVDGTTKKLTENSAEKEAKSGSDVDPTIPNTPVLNLDLSNLDFSNISTEEAEAIALIRRSWPKLTPEQRHKRLDFLKNYTKLTE
jgi:transcriptional regulator with XRE-family HTH domain